MATIRTALQLYDGFSPAFRSMNNALNMVINSFDIMQQTSNQAIDVASISAARSELMKANSYFKEVDEAIDKAKRSQDKFNQSVKRGTGLAGELLGSVKMLAAGFGVREVFQLSDDISMAKARLSLLVDDEGSVAALEKRIFASAQRSRASYVGTAGAISKLGILAGRAFGNTDEIIAFTELMNKNFVIGGSSIQEQESAMLQLTQAMASGRLQGEEFRAIQESAPLLAQSIEQYMRNAGVEGSLKEWSSQGMLTANVIKNAMFSMADETEERFNNIPYTWGQVWTTAVNNVTMVTRPLLSAISFLADNWSIIGPIVWSAVAALIAYNATAGIAWLTTLKAAAALGWKAVCSWAETAALFALIVAQEGFNAALRACPLTWIITTIAMIIGLIYVVVGVINKVTGKTISATGVIVGALMVAAAFIGNLFVGLINFIFDLIASWMNVVAAFANFFGNVFNDPVGAVARLFFDLVDTILGLLESAASAIDTVFGSGLASVVQGWRDGLGRWVDSTFGRGVEVMAKINPEDMHLGRFEYGAAWDFGYNLGSSIEDSIGNLFNGLTPGVDETADNTAAIRDSMEMSQEDLKYLRDIAEREAINRFTTAEIRVEMTNQNQISSDMDIDGIVTKLTDRVQEQLLITAEGVHA